MSRLNSWRTMGWMFLGIAQGALLSPNALAHPIGADEGAVRAEADRDDPRDVAAPGSARSAGVQRLPDSSPAWNLRDEGLRSPADSLTGGDGHLSTSWSGQAPLRIDAGPGAFPREEADSLAGALPLTPNGKSQRSLVQPSPNMAQSDRTTAAEPENEMVTAIRELQTSVVQTLSGAFDASRGNDGQVTFSVAGVEGFRYSAQGGEASLGYGDTAMTVVQQSGGTAVGTASHVPLQASAQPGEDSNSEIIQLIREIMLYPLVWLILLLLAIGKVALMVASRRSRKRIRRRRSGTSHHGQHVKQAKVKRRRVRVRFRIKHAPVSAEPQER